MSPKQTAQDLAVGGWVTHVYDSPSVSPLTKTHSVTTETVRETMSALDDRTPPSPWVSYRLIASGEILNWAIFAGPSTLSAGSLVLPGAGGTWQWQPSTPQLELSREQHALVSRCNRLLRQKVPELLAQPGLDADAASWLLAPISRHESWFGCRVETHLDEALLHRIEEGRELPARDRDTLQVACFFLMAAGLQQSRRTREQQNAATRIKAALIGGAARRIVTMAREEAARAVLTSLVRGSAARRSVRNRLARAVSWLHAAVRGHRV